MNLEADRLNRLVGNVLDFSRLENQRPRLVRTPVVVSDLLEQVRSLWQARCLSAEKELVVENAAADLSFITDVHMVQQILGNVGPQNIASASDVFDASQVDALTQALEKDAAALKKAQDLTTALQGRGLLTPNERVVGVSGTTIYKVGQK